MRPAFVACLGVLAACHTAARDVNVEVASQRLAPAPAVELPAPVETVEPIADVVEPAPVLAAPAAPDAEPAAFAETDYHAFAVDSEVTHSNVAAYCTAQRADACMEIPLGISFKSSGSVLGLHAVAIAKEGGTWRTLLARLEGGVADLPVTWAADDPNDPGCASIVRGVRLEQARMENGVLVVVLLGDTGTMVDPVNDQDSGFRLRLVRQVTLAKVDGNIVHSSTLHAWSGPALGEKVQPGPKFVEWSKLPWKGFKSFKVDADGKLAIDS